MDTCNLDVWRFCLTHVNYWVCYGNYLTRIFADNGWRWTRVDTFCRVHVVSEQLQRLELFFFVVKILSETHAAILSPFHTNISI